MNARCSESWIEFGFILPDNLSFEMAPNPLKAQLAGNYVTCGSLMGMFPPCIFPGKLFNRVEI